MQAAARAPCSACWRGCGRSRRAVHFCPPVLSSAWTRALVCNVCIVACIVQSSSLHEHWPCRHAANYLPSECQLHFDSECGTSGIVPQKQSISIRSTVTYPCIAGAGGRDHGAAQAEQQPVLHQPAPVPGLRQPARPAALPAPARRRVGGGVFTLRARASSTSRTRTSRPRRWRSACAARWRRSSWTTCSAGASRFRC